MKAMNIATNARRLFMKFAVRRFRHKLKDAFHEDITRNIMFNMRSARDKRLISTIKKFFCH